MRDDFAPGGTDGEGKKVKRIKQVAAMCGVILLIALYASTLVIAAMGRECTQLLFADITCTIIVPVFLWAYSFVYRLLKKYYSPNQDEKKDDKQC